MPRIVAVVTDRDEHSHYVHRFQNIFRPTPKKLPIYHVPGNHDLGLHLTRGGSAYSRERFTETFGRLNGEVDLGNHTILWIDAPGLLEETSSASDLSGEGLLEISNGGVVEFLRLFRKGNYQNEVDEATSRFLLETVDPSLIFSGDDHDYCDIPHHLAMSSPRELVSLLNPMTQQPEEVTLASTHLSQLCLLPDQHRIYSHIYIPFVLLSLCVLAFPRIYSNLRSRNGTSARSNGLPLHSNSLSRILRLSKAKPANEEEDVDEDDLLSVSESDEDEHAGHSYSGYAISSPHANYSYHSPTDDEYASMVTPREIVPRQGRNKGLRIDTPYDPSSEEYGEFSTGCTDVN
ncbi:MAG: hypothetical protein CYPHOPRED_004621 [Cyphobasidiales sp. Tagirdzhanova-0007]|nr:MAG: hypothetical protein CYPHOPRED_004621 [Cyphobasidiales sp. Tagirdzhanova-0007]